jgi:hypothetical protein
MSFAPGYCREHFLADLVNKERLARVAELGIWKGRTFLHLLTHCPQAVVIGVDAWKVRPENAGTPGGQTYSEWDMPGLERYVRERAAPFGARAVICKIETAEAALLVPDASLDLVFIDADHSEAGVTDDIANWTPKVKPGGYVTGHDRDWVTVRRVVDRVFPGHSAGPDNVWWIKLPSPA